MVVGFLVWRWLDREVLPEIEETADAFVSLSEAPPGPCYDLDAEGGVLAGWTEVSCSGPRQAEVSFAASFEDGPYPGEQYLEEAATRTCTAAFERYVGLSPEQSQYDVRWLLPTEDLWVNGSRQGICLIVPDDSGLLTGTVKGSGQ